VRSMGERKGLLAAARAGLAGSLLSAYCLGGAPGPHLGPCAPAPTSKLVVNVKAAPYRAAGDGAADDTAAIQKAIRAVAGSGGTVLIPDGTYMIDALAQDHSHGLVLGSRMTLRMAPGAVLKAFPNASQQYGIVAVIDATEVNLVGGTIEGERAGHQGTEGEWGMGIKIRNSSHVALEGVTARECWGDGFYVAGTSSDITLCGVTADHNRRQGLSIVGADGMLVRDSSFLNTVGTDPEFGIDVEPNRGETVTNLQIVDCVVKDNHGGGIGGGPPGKFRGAAFFNRSRIARNLVVGNNNLGIALSACEGNAIEDNRVLATRGHGILLRGGARDMRITGNSVEGSSQDGISLAECPGTLVKGNTVTGSSGRGIHAALGCGAEVTGNQLSGNRWPSF